MTAMLRGTPSWSMPLRIGILGAGVAGLSCAYFLKRAGAAFEVHEASQVVGGLARSFKWHDFDCDIAPHRLYTSDEDLLQELLALVPMRRIRRMSRIHLQERWIQDPVNALEMVLKLPARKSASLIWHYLFRTHVTEDSFDALALNRFGKGLNKLFFKPYSEKLFGIPASEISATWGHRKIRVGGFRDMLRRNSKLYFSHFYYPIHGGYGAICGRLYDEVADSVRVGSRLTAIRSLGSSGYECVFDGPQGPTVERFDRIVSSLPLSYFASLLGLQLSLRFRPANLVYLLVNRSRVGPHHWFYFADREVVLNRVAEFKNFADKDVPRDKTVLCCEVTDLERFSVERVCDQLESAGILHKSEILDTKVIEIKHAYPIYNRAYDSEVVRAREFFAEHPLIHHVGRQAQFEHQDVDEIYGTAKRVAHTIVNGTTLSEPVAASEGASSLRRAAAVASSLGHFMGE
jgi:protoporphyrinogen oxidase